MEFSRGKYAMTADCRLHYFFALEEMKFNEIINVPQKVCYFAAFATQSHNATSSHFSFQSFITKIHFLYSFSFLVSSYPTYYFRFHLFGSD